MIPNRTARIDVSKQQKEESFRDIYNDVSSFFSITQQSTRPETESSFSCCGISLRMSERARSDVPALHAMICSGSELWGVIRTGRGSCVL